jgi:hypothetical protein
MDIERQGAFTARKRTRKRRDTLLMHHSWIGVAKGKELLPFFFGLLFYFFFVSP